MSAEPSCTGIIQRSPPAPTSVPTPASAPTNSKTDFFRARAQGIVNRCLYIPTDQPILDDRPGLGIKAGSKFFLIRQLSQHAQYLTPAFALSRTLPAITPPEYKDMSPTELATLATELKPASEPGCSSL
ncbi:hypothetical protein BGY98DRAFT_1099640 [Russula aff. rugulosa BPL654]|nr:hypothetical protein BGY98DRAFT_1099640 [Russula aff. rugulosa BPL654]